MRRRAPIEARPAGTRSQTPAARATGVASVAVLAVEMAGALSMWAVIPAAWIWVAARVFDTTDSLAAAGSVALLGVAATETLTVVGLTRVDRLWIELRRRAGYPQADGALTRIVVVTATLGLLAFLIWYYVLTNAFVIPFMPSQ